MRQTTIARSYAEALYETGAKHGQNEEFARAFAELETVLSTEPRIRVFLETPKVEPEQKRRVLSDALEGRVPKLFLNFVQVVLDQRRQRLLRVIAHEYHAVLDERLGRVHARITLAREPDEATREAIMGRLDTLIEETVVSSFRVDPEILGGIIVRYGDRVIDGSVRRRMLALKGELLRAG